MGAAFVQSSELPLRVNLPDGSGQMCVDVASLAEINSPLSIYDDTRPRMCRRCERRKAEERQHHRENAEVVFHKPILTPPGLGICQRIVNRLSNKCSRLMPPRPKLSDGGHEAQTAQAVVVTVVLFSRLQPRPPAAVRCSAW